MDQKQQQLDVTLDAVQRALEETAVLEAVLHYLRTDHVGLVKGDGEMTRYLRYLNQKARDALILAEGELKSAGAKGVLPF